MEGERGDGMVGEERGRRGGDGMVGEERERRGERGW